MPAESFLVFVNGVSVGRISAQALNDIRAAAWRNGQVAFAQASNCLTAAMNLAGLVLFLPWSILGLVLTLLSVLDPTWVTGALAQMQGDLPVAVPRLFQTMLLISVAMAPMLLCFPGQLRRLGLRNCYQEHIDSEIRYRVSCPATGVVSLLDDRALTAPIEAAKVD